MNFWTDPTNLVLAAFAAGSGALLAWPKLLGGGGATSVGTLEVTQLINSKNALVLDVRETGEFSNGSITGARNIPSAEVAERIGEIARFKARPAIVVCQTGQRSGKVAAQLQKSGFTEVYHLSGGLGAWQQAGLPIVVGKQGTKASVRSIEKSGAQPDKRGAARREARQAAKKELSRQESQPTRQDGKQEPQEAMHEAAQDAMQAKTAPKT